MFSDVMASKEEEGMRRQYSNNFLPAANPEHMIIIEARIRNTNQENADISISSVQSSPEKSSKDYRIYPDSPSPMKKGVLITEVQQKDELSMMTAKKRDKLIGKVVIYDKVIRT